MRTKAVIGYVALLILSLLLHTAKPANTLYYSLLPALMLIFPIIVGHRVKLRFSIKDFILGLVVSISILAPYYVIFGESMKTITGLRPAVSAPQRIVPRRILLQGFSSGYDRQEFQGCVACEPVVCSCTHAESTSSRRLDVAPHLFPVARHGLALHEDE